MQHTCIYLSMCYIHIRCNFVAVVHFQHSQQKHFDMCKTCEINGVLMELIPLTEEEIQSSPLPQFWTENLMDFHPDLLLRAQAAMAWAKREGFETNMKAHLSALGKGFVIHFCRSSFEPAIGATFYDLRKKGLDAIEELAIFYGDRVSSVVWDAFAHLAVREEPEEKRSILKEQDTLPHHYGIVDTALHAAGKVYTFMMHVQSVFFKHTGMILVHNCDCNCSLLNLKKVDGQVVFNLQKSEILEPTQSLFTHLLAEGHLILDQKLPFEFSVTEEAKLLFG